MGSMSKIMDDLGPDGGPPPGSEDTSNAPAESTSDVSTDEIAELDELSAALSTDTADAVVDDDAMSASEPSANAPADVEATAAAPPSRFAPTAPNFRSTADAETAPWDPQRVDPSVITFHNRYAAICEQYRAVRARLLSMNPRGRHQVVAVTSSVPEEGKSVTSLNLAISMAEGGEQRVLIADADFRRSSMARMLGVRQSPGLVDVILGKARLEEVLLPTPYANLKVIPAGKVSDRSYGELLATPQIRDALEEIRTSFTYSFIDTPPVTTVSDVSMLAPLCDGALMIVEMGRTPEPTVQLAVRTLQTNNVNVLGCVLSRYRDQRLHYYDRYSYYYYHTGDRPGTGD